MLKTHAHAKTQMSARAPGVPVPNALAHQQQLRQVLYLAGVQPRLEIGSVDEPLEREKALASSSLASPASPEVEASLNALKGGSPLDAQSRAFFEPRFGADFSQVRLHTGAEAACMAHSLGAKAFTLGNDIAFGASSSPAEKNLLAHELAHVVQQNGVQQNGVQQNGVQQNEGGGSKQQAKRVQRQLWTPEVWEEKLRLQKEEWERVKARKRKVLTSSPRFRRLMKNHQQMLLRMLDGDILISETKLIALLDSAHFRRLSSQQKTKALGDLSTLLGTQNLFPQAKDQILDIFAAADVSSRAELMRLSRRKVGDKSALLDTDKDNNTLLHSLHLLATQALDAEFAQENISREQLLRNIMQEAANPGEINQDTKGTCTVTSMQYMLNKQNPAEYLRIMQGLTSAGGQVVLRGGETLLRDPGSVAGDNATNRSASERLFQAAMMELSNGADNYDNVTDLSTSADLSAYGGLDVGQQQAGLKALFGQNFKSETNKAAIEQLLIAHSGQLTYARLHWGDGGHAVVVEKLKNGRVYFRNPWGAQQIPNGTLLQNPPRRMENNKIGLESMTLVAFKEHVRSCLIPE